MSENTLGAIVIILIFIFWILTSGDPDILDGLIKMINK